jgi:hypothetical protein
MVGDSLVDAMSLLHAEWMICAIAGAPGTRHLKRDSAGRKSKMTKPLGPYSS